MYFKDLVKRDFKEDVENNSYTRYLFRFNENCENVELVAIKTADKSLDVCLYDIDLPKPSRKDVLNGSYMELLNCTYLENDGLDFFVEEEPIARLNSLVFEKKSIIQGVCTREDMQRKGYGSYLLQVAQDYYKNTDHTGCGPKKTIYANKFNSLANLVYANGLERRLGGMGTWLAKTRAKVTGNDQSTRAYGKFLRKNNFCCESADILDIPCKPILHKRNIIDERLLDEANCPRVIQCFDKVVDISDFTQESSEEILEQ